MGQKTHPIGFRLGFNKTWSSIWFDEKNYTKKLNEDIKIRQYLQKRLENSGVSKIEIKRTSKLVSVIIHTSRPGIVIGKKGEGVTQLQAELKKLINNDVQVNVEEVKRPELDATLVAENIASQIVKKVSYRRAVKKAIQAAMRMDAQGIKVQVNGRLGGAEIARSETYREGRVPLHTLRANIDFATATAHTTYGCVGVKVWICLGEAYKMKSTEVR